MVGDPMRGIAAPLARAQAAFAELAKSKTANVPLKGGGSYSYSYADLGDVIRVVRPALAAEGIAVTQPIDTTDDGETVLRTMLLHADGMLVSSMLLPVRGIAPQQVGSVLTYYRRYALCAVLGIAAEDDDDAAAAKDAVHAPRKARPQRQVTEAAPPPDERRAEAAAWADALTGDRLADWAAWKQEHPGWHKTAQAFDAAYLRLRDLVAAENTAQGAEPFDDDPATSAPRPASDKQMRALFAALKAIDVGEAERHEWAAGYLGRDVASFADLSGADVARLIDIAAAEAEVAS